MKRVTLPLVLLLALVAAACSSGPSASTSASEAPATAEPTPEPTPEATTEPSHDASPLPSFSFGGTDSALLDLLPDTLGGNARTDVNLADFPAFTAALEAQNMDADDVEYAISTWGTGADVVTATAMRLPGTGRPQLEQMARIMSGAAAGEGSAEVVTIGGKEVLAIASAEAGRVGYMYFLGDDGVFIISGTDEALIEELFSGLP